MRKWNKKTKIVFIIFLILAVLFAALCWKKRRGIYNTYMKLTGQEIPYSVQEKRRKKYGYYDQELNASMNLENPVYITEKDDSANEIETDIPKETTQPSIRNPNSAAVKWNPNLISFSALAPNMTGIARKNVNSAATSLDTPMISAPTIVAPDLDVPGIIAKHCTSPIKRAVLYGFLLKISALKF